jgi:hypothetical protein
LKDNEQDLNCCPGKGGAQRLGLCAGVAFIERPARNKSSTEKLLMKITTKS